MVVEERLRARGLILPAAPKPPNDLPIPYAWVRVWGDRAYIAAHPPLLPDGTLAGPFGKVGAEVSPETATHAARLTALSILGSLQRALGDLDRVVAWLRVCGMVQAAPGFTRLADVINGFSDLLNELYGPVVGSHARSAVGMAMLAFNNCVVIEAEVAITPPLSEESKNL